jgi:hypothetical protein
MKLGCTGTISKQMRNRRRGWENSRRDQKSTSELVKCEGILDRFFFLLEGRRSSWACSTWSDNQWTVLLGVMKRLRGAMRRKRPEGWRDKTWMLHHDNEPAQTSLLIREFLAKHETTLVPQPPYSPDLAPADFRSWNPLRKVADLRW